MYRVSRQASAKDNPHGDAVVGLFSPNGNGNVNITQDENSGGTLFHQMMSSGTYAVASNGRTTVSLNGSSALVCYLAAANEGYCINLGAGASVDLFEPQIGSGFGPASFSGQFLGGSLPEYISGLFNQIDTNFTDGIGTFTSTYTQSGENISQQNQTLTGTYTVDSTGGITISQGGNAIYYGYVVSRTEVVLISLDDNPRTLVEVH